MKKIFKMLLLLACVITAAVLVSCVGVSADISIKADGSGRISLEYRVSQMLESMGRLDGNERWPAIPVGKADFERSLARIPGLRLVSHKVKEVSNDSGGKDLVTKVVLEFSDTSALLNFLDSSGTEAVLSQENGKNKLKLSLRNPSAGVVNADFIRLMQDLTAGYNFYISMNVPKGADLSSLPAVPAAKTVAHGKKVSYNVDMAEFIKFGEDVELVIVW